ncbi:tRNA N6-adenosine threonylcarbamoyltransferase, mitochondrial [Nanoarchaeota archaeon]
MIISLGIESTAHTYSIGIVDEEGKIYSNERIIYKSEKGGIHPREAAELHSREAINILKNSVWKAGFIFKEINNKYYIVDALYEIKNKLNNVEEKFTEEPWNRFRYLIYNGKKIWIENNKIKSDDKNLEDNLNNYINNLNEFERRINLISYSAGPGLYPTLVQAYFSANLFSKKFNTEKIGVNHLIAHSEIVKLYNKFENPLILLVSGANTMLLSFEGNRYRIIGETLDTGVGNFLDKVGRLLNIGFPAGPKIEEYAKKGKNLIKLPYGVKGMDVQLGGIYTYIKNLLKKENISIEDLSYSIQEYIFSMLAEVSERALSLLNKKEFGLTGGVAVNKRLQEILKTMCEERNVKFGTVPLDLGNDNGAMIAWTGILWYKKNINIIDGINPYCRPEEIEYKI